MIELVDSDGTTVARNVDGQWICPLGLKFSEKDVRDMSALAAGEIDDVAFGCLGIKVVRS